MEEKRQIQSFYDARIGGHCKYSIKIPSPDLVILIDEDPNASVKLINVLCPSFFNALALMFEFNPDAAITVIDSNKNYLYFGSINELTSHTDN